MDSDSEAEESMRETCSLLFGLGNRSRPKPSKDPRGTARVIPALSSAGGTTMSSEEANKRMRGVFENGLAIHLSGEQMEACRAVATPLHEHQRVALAWMVKHENNETDGLRGGILADDMGLGKTLSIIALILTNHHDGRPLLKPNLGFERNAIVNTRKRKLAVRKSAAVNVDSLGVGSKIKTKSTATKQSIFGKFKETRKERDSQESYFKFGGKSIASKRSKRKGKSFIVDDNESDEDPDTDDDEANTDEDDSSSSDDEWRPCLNVDGNFELDSESDDELIRSKSTKRFRVYSDDDEEKKEGSEDNESDCSLPEILVESEEEETSEIPDKNLDVEKEKNAPETGTKSKDESSATKASNIKMIIPPKEPADRNGRRRPTLVVCPKSLIHHWVQQLHEHLDKSVDIKVKIHHGQDKATSGSELDTYDVVMTTYGTLAAEFNSNTASPLFRAKWLRVVLDEGHLIKNHRTKAAKGALQLDSKRRWVVSGTPIQNNLMELWSLVNWLDFGMYAGQQKAFREQIEKPCKNKEDIGFDRLRLLMDAICLRRSKEDKKPDGEPLVDLPKKRVMIREVVFSEDEKLFYEAYLKKSTEIVTRYKAKGELMKNYGHVFALMTRLRQLCMHWDLIANVDWAMARRDRKELEDLIDRCDDLLKGSYENVPSHAFIPALRAQLRSMVANGEDCSICLAPLQAPAITTCGHAFCKACILRVLDTAQPPTCPLCRTAIDKANLLEMETEDQTEEAGDSIEKEMLLAMEDIKVEVSSSKVNAAIKEILRIRRDQPDDKIVVVSQMTSFLSIVQPLLKEEKIKFTRLDGGMSTDLQREIIQSFQSAVAESDEFTESVCLIPMI